MNKYSLNIFNELPGLIQESVKVLAVAPTLNESIAEQLLKSPGVANGNASSVVS